VPRRPDQGHSGRYKDYFPGLGPVVNRAAGARATMQKIIELRDAEAAASA